MKKRKIEKNKREKKENFFQKNKNIIILFLIICFFTLIIYAMNYQGNYKNSIIMVTDSKACYCVKNRCFSLKNQISDLLKNKFNNSVKFKVIEYRDNSRSEKIMNKYNMGMIPAVVIVNKKGEPIYNSNFYSFNIDDFTNKLYELKGRNQ